MDVRRTADRTRYRTMTTDELRGAFLNEDVFKPGALTLTVYLEIDRAILGAAVPLREALDLPCPENLRAEFFCQRRELGVLNIGGPGTIAVDGKPHAMATHDVLYVGRGGKAVSFASASAEQPAKYILLSYPAHAGHPTAHATKDQANRVELGSDAEANKRTIFQYIHENGIKSCQLVMGFTELAKGSVWNTMPPHTHDRRSEVYLYFDIAEGHRVLHLMGEPSETRGLWMAEGHAAVSPPWSVHCGCGTSHYRFLWAMGGENQRFDDMDPAPIPSLR